MSEVEYLHLPAGSSLPIRNATPRKTIVVVEQDVTEEWRAEVSDWIVASGCLCMMAWGLECSLWDDSVDIANLQRIDFGDMPDEQFVMTTWHEDDPLSEVFWFSQNCAQHPTLDLSRTTILHIAERPDRDGMLRSYEEAK
ncbi:MAG: hypothetical protein AAF553_11160 [Pseudomonadota bacterium]